MEILLDQTEKQELVELTAEIVSAYVSNNSINPAQLSELIGSVHAALQSGPSGAPESEAAPQEAAVSIRTSVKPDFIVCLEDGKRFKSLKRHLSTDHNLTPDQYRAKWNLKPGYPMVAPNYAASRSQFAKDRGFGRKRTSSAPDESATPAETSQSGTGEAPNPTPARKRATRQNGGAE